MSIDDERKQSRKALIRLPNQIHYNPSILPLWSKKTAKHADSIANDSLRDVGTLSVVSNFIDSRKEKSSKVKMESRLQQKISAHTKIHFKFMDKRASMLSDKKARLTYPEQPIDDVHEEVESEDIEEIDTRNDVVRIKPSIRDIDKRSNLFPTESNSKWTFKQTNLSSQGLSSFRALPQKRLTRTSSKQLSSECGLNENVKVNIPVTVYAKTMKKVHLGASFADLVKDSICKPPLSLTMAVHPDSMFSTSDLKALFSASEIQTLSEIYKKHASTNKMADYCRQRISWYRQKIESQTRFPSTALLHVIFSKCRLIQELSNRGSIPDLTLDKNLLVIKQCQSMLLNNLAQVLHGFLSIEEFNCMAGALERSPSSFIDCSKDEAMNLLATFDLCSYKLVSKELITVLDTLLERFSRVQDQLETLGLANTMQRIQTQNALTTALVDPSLLRLGSSTSAGN